MKNMKNKSNYKVFLPTLWAFRPPLDTHSVIKHVKRVGTRNWSHDITRSALRVSTFEKEAWFHWLTYVATASAIALRSIMTDNKPANLTMEFIRHQTRVRGNETSKNNWLLLRHPIFYESTFQGSRLSRRFPVCLYVLRNSEFMQ